MIDEIRRYMDTLDFDALAALYAEEAVIEEVSALHPPSHPRVVKGREAVLDRLRSEVLRDPVSGWERHITSAKIVDAVETRDALAYTEVFTFAAGDKVIAQHLAHLRKGHIERDRVLVAWDTAEPG
jgi:hypothetical protein